MSKRFTETEKWDDQWFRSLGPSTKLVLFFLRDRCDAAGFWEIDIEALEHFCKLPSDKLRGLFEGLNKSHEGLGKVLIRRGGYVWLKDFVDEQKNLPLNPLNNAHRKIIASIKARVEFEEASLLLSDSECDTRARVSQKEAVWVRDSGVCQYCSKSIEAESDYELDHIVPRAANISEVYTNFATACKQCNRDKSDTPTALTVGDYSSVEAKRDLRKNPTLLLRFNTFFGRNLRVRDESLTELAPHNGATSPIGNGKGKGQEKEEGMQGEKPKRAASNTETDDDWLAGLEKSEAYRGITVRVQLSKAQIWCRENAGRKCTRKFFLGWLNRTRADERTIATANGAPTSKFKLPGHS